MSIERDLELLYEIGCLRFIDRTWKQFLGKNAANLSEHTLRVSYLSMMIANKEGITDIGKVLKMALVHDLSESRTGDANYLQSQFVTRQENKAIKETLKDTILEELKDLWEECEARETIEARIVRDADILDQDLELKEWASMGHDGNKVWRETRIQAFKKLSTNYAKELWQAIQDSNPHDWHLHASNRLTTGDWKTEESNSNS